mmetsp:Transcript_33712/g.94819  ORF Transcript_33712/g.94819 Transcript_33712/m.94819 type:complete len:845 (+) Transcript_33712:566-3100(+)
MGLGPCLCLQQRVQLSGPVPLVTPVQRLGRRQPRCGHVRRDGEEGTCLGVIDPRGGSPGQEVHHHRMPGRVLLRQLHRHVDLPLGEASHHLQLADHVEGSLFHGCSGAGPDDPQRHQDGAQVPVEGSIQGLGREPCGVEQHLQLLFGHHLPVQMGRHSAEELIRRGAGRARDPVCRGRRGCSLVLNRQLEGLEYRAQAHPLALPVPEVHGEGAPPVEVQPCNPVRDVAREHLDHPLLVLVPGSPRPPCLPVFQVAFHHATELGRAASVGQQGSQAAVVAHRGLFHCLPQLLPREVRQDAPESPLGRGDIPLHRAGSAVLEPAAEQPPPVRVREQPFQLGLAAFEGHRAHPPPRPLHLLAFQPALPTRFLQSRARQEIVHELPNLLLLLQDLHPQRGEGTCPRPAVFSLRSAQELGNGAGVVRIQGFDRARSAIQAHTGQGALGEPTILEPCSSPSLTSRGGTSCVAAVHLQHGLQLGPQRVPGHRVAMPLAAVQAVYLASDADSLDGQERRALPCGRLASHGMAHVHEAAVRGPAGPEAACQYFGGVHVLPVRGHLQVSRLGSPALRCLRLGLQSDVTGEERRSLARLSAEHRARQGRQIHTAVRGRRFSERRGSHVDILVHILFSVHHTATAGPPSRAPSLPLGRGDAAEGGVQGDAGPMRLGRDLSAHHLHGLHTRFLVVGVQNVPVVPAEVLHLERPFPAVRVPSRVGRVGRVRDELRALLLRMLPELLLVLGHGLFVGDAGARGLVDLVDVEQSDVGGAVEAHAGRGLGPPCVHVDPDLPLPELHNIIQSDARHVDRLQKAHLPEALAPHDQVGQRFQRLRLDARLPRQLVHPGLHVVAL